MVSDSSNPRIPLWIPTEQKSRTWERAKTFFVIQFRFLCMVLPFIIPLPLLLYSSHIIYEGKMLGWADALPQSIPLYLIKMALFVQFHFCLFEMVLHIVISLVVPATGKFSWDWTTSKLVQFLKCWRIAIGLCLVISYLSLAWICESYYLVGIAAATGYCYHCSISELDLYAKYTHLEMEYRFQDEAVFEVLHFEKEQNKAFLQNY